MAAKPKKSRKRKRTPVRIISPQTVEMPADTAPAPAVFKDSASSSPSESRKPSTIVQEIKRIGIIAAVILILLIILSFIF